jgi:large subunit ribosomal protein L15
MRQFVLALLAGVATGFAPVSSAISAHRCAPAVTMKVYDWQTRGTPPPDLETLDLSNMKVSPGSHKAKTRKGRGISAGQGATCGFGTRGQKSRAGRSVRPGFEGGQIPLYRRLPKFVGRPMGKGHSKTLYGLVKLDVLNTLPEGSTVDYASLQEQKLVSKSKCVSRLAHAAHAARPVQARAASALPLRRPVSPRDALCRRLRAQVRAQEGGVWPGGVHGQGPHHQGARLHHHGPRRHRGQRRHVRRPAQDGARRGACRGACRGGGGVSSLMILSMRNGAWTPRTVPRHQPATDMKCA